MSTATTVTEVTLGVIDASFPELLRPHATRESPFWTGTQDERTFAYVPYGTERNSVLLIVPFSDARGEGMRKPAIHSEADWVRAVGLNPDLVRVWTVAVGHVSTLEEVPEPLSPSASLTLRTLKLVVPVSARPASSQHREFWTSPKDEDRTFFTLRVGDGPILVAVVHSEDPRSRGMREPMSGERFAMEEAGLDLSEYLVWSFHEDSFEPVAEPVSEITKYPVGTVIQNKQDSSSAGQYRRAEDDGSGQVWESIKTGMRFGGGGVLSDEIIAEHYKVLDPLAGLPIEPMDPKPDLQPTVDRLQTQLEESRRETEEARRLHRLDIALISDRLNEECERRDWCEEYDRIADEINQHLTYTLDLPERTKEYVVEVDVIVRVSRTVTASSEEDAEATAQEGIDMDDLRYGDVQDTSAFSVNEA